MKQWTLTALLLAGLLAVPAAARAQGALVHASVGAAASGGETSPAFGGGISWRVNRALGFGVELSHLSSLVSDSPVYDCCSDEQEARATVFTTNVRIEIPSTSPRVIPYVIVGGGVASVTQSDQVIYARIADRRGLNPVFTGLGLNTVPVMRGPVELETTATSMALTLGGGASLRLTEHVAVDADARVLHLATDQARNISRFSLGISYRF
jgi:opacity protein-like surface antigen